MRGKEHFVGYRGQTLCLCFDSVGDDGRRRRKGADVRRCGMTRRSRASVRDAFSRRGDVDGGQR